MNWKPWNRGRFKPAPNPNGFYPERLVVNILTCHGCTDRTWIFDPMGSLDFIGDHLHCPGAIEVTPATYEYQALVQATYLEALHMIGQRS